MSAKCTKCKHKVLGSRVFKSQVRPTIVRLIPPLYIKDSKDKMLHKVIIFKCKDVQHTICE